MIHTSSRRRIPAHGKPACSGSTFTTMSPNCLILSSLRNISSASSRNVISLSPNLIRHLLLSQSVFCCLAASNTYRSAGSMSVVDFGMYAWIIRRFCSSSSAKAFFKKSWLCVLSGLGGCPPTGDAARLALGVSECVDKAVFAETAPRIGKEPEDPETASLFTGFGGSNFASSRSRLRMIEARTLLVVEMLL